jgi:hypothetical protein
MSSDMGDVSGTKARPWVLHTPGGASGFRAYRDPTQDPPAIVIQAGGTEVSYHLRCLNDLDEMLKAHGDWLPLGIADEKAAAAEGTVEAWARSPKNPVRGWYGLKKGQRGRFAAFIPPIMAALGLAEIQDDPKNPRMRAV